MSKQLLNIENTKRGNIRLFKKSNDSKTNSRSQITNEY